MQSGQDQAREAEHWLEGFRAPGSDPLPGWVEEKLLTAWKAGNSAAVARQTEQQQQRPDMVVLAQQAEAQLFPKGTERAVASPMNVILTSLSVATAKADADVIRMREAALKLPDVQKEDVSAGSIPTMRLVDLIQNARRVALSVDEPANASSGLSAGEKTPDGKKMHQTLRAVRAYLRSENYVAAREEVEAWTLEEHQRGSGSTPPAAVPSLPGDSQSSLAMPVERTSGGVGGRV